MRNHTPHLVDFYLINVIDTPICMIMFWNSDLDNLSFLLKSLSKMKKNLLWFLERYTLPGLHEFSCGTIQIVDSNFRHISKC